MPRQYLYSERFVYKGVYVLAVVVVCYTVLRLANIVLMGSMLARSAEGHANEDGDLQYGF